MTCTKENYSNYDDLSSNIEKRKKEESVLDKTIEKHQAPREEGSTGDLGLGSTPENANLSLLAITHQNTVSDGSKSTQIEENNQNKATDSNRNSSHTNRREVQNHHQDTQQPTQTEENFAHQRTQTQTGRMTQRASEVRPKPVCRHYRHGTCKYGNRGLGCPFSHPKPCSHKILAPATGRPFI